MSMTAEDRELGVLRAVYLSWQIDRIPAVPADGEHAALPAFLVARRGGYEAKAEDADGLRASIVEWARGGGLTGGGITSDEFVARVAG